MTVTLYYSKVNVSSHILKVYGDKGLMGEITNKISNNIKDNITVSRKQFLPDKEGEERFTERKYKFHAIEKNFGDELNNTIKGKIVKDSLIFASKYDEKTEQQTKVPIESSEVIDFFYDIKKEIVVFHTRDRFGYADFTDAFQELLNKSMENEEEKFLFKVRLVRKGLSVELIKEQLKAIGQLQELRIEIDPPNPNDDLLDNIQDDGEEYLESIKQGNITQRSVLFTSDAPEGLNVDAKLINKEINQIDKIHSKLSAEKATKNGYVYVGARNKAGRSYSTKQNELVRERVEDLPSNPKEFALFCKKKVSEMLRSVL